MSAEYHIASFIVLVRPETLAQVCDCLNALPGTEVHQHDNHSKIVITIESHSTAMISHTTHAIGLLDGVLACNMVYHQFENEAAGLIEVAHED